MAVRVNQSVDGKKEPGFAVNMTFPETSSLCLRCHQAAGGLPTLSGWIIWVSTPGHTPWEGFPRNLKTLASECCLPTVG